MLHHSLGARSLQSDSPHRRGIRTYVRGRARGMGLFQLHHLWVVDDPFNLVYILRHHQNQLFKPCFIKRSNTEAPVISNAASTQESPHPMRKTTQRQHRLDLTVRENFFFSHAVNDIELGKKGTIRPKTSCA